MQAASGPCQETRVGVQLMLQRPERRWGQHESSGVSDSAVCVGGVLGGGGLPQAELEAASPCCWQSSGGAARLRMGCEPRPQAAEGAGARVEPELRHPGASEHLRAAPRARGGRGSAGSGPGAGPSGEAGSGAPPSQPLGHVGRGSAGPWRHGAASRLEAG